MRGTTLTFTPAGGNSGNFTLTSRCSFGYFEGGGTGVIAIKPGGGSRALGARGRMMIHVSGAGSCSAPLEADYPLEAIGTSAGCKG